MKVIRTTISILCLIFLTVSVYAADYYVVNGGTGNGSDWGNALGIIQDAIDLADANGETDTIHVAAGTYNEHLNLVSDVTLWGGYPALGGAPEERDRIENPTYIDGSEAGRPVTIDGPSNITIDGFVVQNGSVTDEHGGGVYINGSNIKIVNNTIMKNEARVSDLENPNLSSWGAGIGVINSSSVEIENNKIGGDTESEGNNTNTAGGGISFYYECTGVISGNTILNNTAGESGGGIHIQACDTGTVTIENNTISENEAGSSGGGIYISADDQAGKVIKNNTISENVAGYSGGGISINGYCIIDDNIITNNEATEYGGGISFGYTDGGSVTKNEIIGNTAQLGGGIHVNDAYHSPNNPPKIGGALGDCNHIYNNVNFDLYYLGCVEEGCTSETLNATYNYWGMLNESEIAARIGISGDGSVNFNPWTNESCDTPLAVGLSSFTASWVDKKLTLKWRTESEINNLGFNIYRSNSQNGKYTKANSRLIAGAGSDATPHDYSFTDEEVVFGKTYYYYIEDVDFTGKTNKSHIIEVTVGKIEVTTSRQGIKTHFVSPTFALLQNYPNPFNPETWIPFKLAQNANVVIYIHSAEGKLIRTITLGNRNAGIYITKDKAAYWDGRDSLRQKVASGLYLYTLEAGEFRATRKMVILK
ncbi:right-handed parallel beta-helix repeat-containing protein [bacterium]|nr:right-handed parallel beta-helix repeat-containing protein [bacterium]